MRKSLHSLLTPVLVVLLALGAAGCSKKAREAKYLARADKYYTAGDYDAAEIEYINVVRRLDPASQRAYAQLGLIALEQGRMSRAYQLLAHAAKLDTNNVTLHAKLALLYLTIGKNKEAYEEAGYVLARQPQDPDAPLVLADTVTKPLDIDAVRRRLSALQLPAGKRAAVEVALGNLDLRMRDYKSAEASFERAKGEDPKFAPTYMMLGNLYWAEKDLKRADENFKECVELSPVRSPRRVRYAQFKIQTGDQAGARKLLEDTLKQAPDYVEAALALAELASVEKKYDEGLQLAQDAARRDPDNYEAMMLSGRLELALAKGDQAVAEFEKMAKLYTKSPQVLYQLALAYNLSGDTVKAIATLNQVLALNPGFADATITLAQLRIARGDFDPAIVSLRPLIQQRPDLSQPRFLLGDAYVQQGNLDEALKVYQQLEADFPKNAQTPFLVGKILETQRRVDEARAEYDKSLTLAPDNIRVLGQLVNLELAQGHYSNALARVQTQLDQNPREQAPHVLLARVYLAEGQTNQAEATLEQSLQLDTNAPAPYLSLSELYIIQNQIPKALDVLNKLLVVDPKNIQGWAREGVIHLVKDNYPASRDAYEKVLSLDPNSAVALNNLAYLYSEKVVDLNRAYDMARRARDLAPSEPSTADTLGWILYKRGDYAQALSLETESAAKLKDNPEVQLHLGQAAYMMGQEDVARASLQYAIQSKQDFPGKDEAARCLEILAMDGKSAGADDRTLLEKRVVQNPNDPSALGRLAAIYKRDGMTNKAVETYEAAYKANPKDVRVLVGLAGLYLNQPDKTDRAFTLAKAAYAMAPDDADVIRVLGRAAFLGADYKWSFTLLQQAAQQQPGDSELAYDLAEAAYSRGQVKIAEASARSALAGTNFSRVAAAKQLLDTMALAANPAQAVASAAQVGQMLKAQPDYVPALMAQGMINEQKPDPAAAIQVYQQVLKLYPDFLPAKRQLAILYAQTQSDPKQAFPIASQARQAYPDDPATAEALGIIMYRQGDYAKSARFLQEAVAQKGDDAQIMYYLGMDQYQLKQRADSKKNLTGALALKLPDALAREASRVLGELK